MNKQFEILSVSMEREPGGIERAKKIINGKGMIWNHVVKNEKDLSKLISDFQVSLYPTQVLIDSNGKVLLYLTGATEENFKQLEELIRRL